MADELNLSNLKPAQARKDRKRVGRGLGSGKGRYSGPRDQGPEVARGLAQDARRLRGRPDADLHAARQAARHDLEGRDADRPVPDVHAAGQRPRPRPRFDDGAEVTPEALVEKGLIKNTKIDVKILGTGDLTKKLTVTAHGFSASAREKIEAAGGTATLLREPKVQEGAHTHAAKPSPTRAEEPEATERGRGGRRAEAPPSGARRRRVFSWLANAWRVPELRKRVLFTAMILAVYRLGSWMPAPGVDSEQIEQLLQRPRRRDPRRCSTSSRAARSRGSRSSRSGSCRTSRPRSSSS